jgi:hypothetical protein
VCPADGFTEISGSVFRLSGSQQYFYGPSRPRFSRHLSRRGAQEPARRRRVEWALSPRVAPIRGCAPALLEPSVARGSHREAHDQIEADAAAQRGATGHKSLGAEAILRQDPRTEPNRTKKSPAPRFHTIRKWVRKEIYQTYSGRTYGADLFGWLAE